MAMKRYSTLPRAPELIPSDAVYCHTQDIPFWLDRGVYSSAGDTVNVIYSLTDRAADQKGEGVQTMNTIKEWEKRDEAADDNL